MLHSLCSSLSANCRQLNLAVPHKSLEMPGSSTGASSHHTDDTECLSELEDVGLVVRLDLVSFF